MKGGIKNLHSQGSQILNNKIQPVNSSLFGLIQIACVIETASMKRNIPYGNDVFFNHYYSLYNFANGKKVSMFKKKTNSKNRKVLMIKQTKCSFITMDVEAIRIINILQGHDMLKLIREGEKKESEFEKSFLFLNFIPGHVKLGRVSVKKRICFRPDKSDKWSVLKYVENIVGKLKGFLLFKKIFIIPFSFNHKTNVPPEIE